MAVNVKYINPFIKATQSVLKNACQEDTSLGKLFLKQSPYSSNRVAIIIGITGHIKGQVIFSIGEETACYIASKMMMGMPVNDLDEMAKSAISELTNMILGNTATMFYNDGVLIDITPPSFLMGQNMQISTNKNSQTICIPLILQNGQNFEIDVSLQENN